MTDYIILLVETTFFYDIRWFVVTKVIIIMCDNFILTGLGFHVSFLYYFISVPFITQMIRYSTMKHEMQGKIAISVSSSYAAVIQTCRVP